jgi:hypothetical protein
MSKTTRCPIEAECSNANRLIGIAAFNCNRKSTNSVRQLQKRKAQKAVTAQRVSSKKQARKPNKCRGTGARRKTLTSHAKVQGVHNHFTKASISKRKAQNAPT